MTNNDILKAIPLDFALPPTFIAMVVPVLKTPAMVASALSAGLVALLAYSLPFKLGLILAALTGIIVGILLRKSSLKAKRVDFCSRHMIKQKICSRSRSC